MIEDQMIHGGWPSSIHRWVEPARIEQETPLVPRAVATGVWEEAVAWLGEELPREWQARLTERAEALYANNGRVRRRLRGPGNAGRDWLWTFMRHWLAALLWRHRPDLHARLPAAFNVGCPLPARPPLQEQPAASPQLPATDAQIDRLVYDLYGLTDTEIQIAKRLA
jgi:hypothetical protein